MQQLVMIITLIFVSTSVLAEIKFDPRSDIHKYLNKTGNGYKKEGKIDEYTRGKCSVEIHEETRLGPYAIQIEMERAYDDSIIPEIIDKKYHRKNAIIYKTSRFDTGTSYCGSFATTKDLEKKLILKKNSVEIEVSYKCWWALFRIKESSKCFFN